MIELINTFFLMVITKPLLMFLSFRFLQWLIPNQEGVLSFLPFWLNLLIYVLIDDFSQYSYHRFAHENKWFWKWHRSHHTATEMGLLVSYRQNIYFYMLMPNVWLLGIYTYFGGGIAVAVAIVLKQIVVIASHSMVHWDAVFYKNKTLTPIIKVLERIIVTPAFHHAHHSVSRIDGIGNPEGNFGNMFTIWDQLFGTAKFPHAFSKDYGIPNDTYDSWAAHSFYPFVTSDKVGSDISKDFKFEKTTVNEPAILTLKEGDYLYCQCGYSKNQPFCDGSHHGTKFQPIKFTIKKEREYKLCQCKGCAKGPFCDDAHLKMM
jgi:sterol desaturase/sphingolipid hydroxylase (fatty acid hydroxylase superfamily)/CDGSH-type Zn-finger protein